MLIVLERWCAYCTGALLCLLYWSAVVFIVLERALEFLFYWSAGEIIVPERALVCLCTGALVCDYRTGAPE